MPSEAAKKRQAQKRGKRQASSRSAQKRAQVQQPSEINGDVGSTVPETEQNGGATGVSSSSDGGVSTSVNDVSRGVAQLKLSPRSCTGESNGGGGRYAFNHIKRFDADYQRNIIV